MISGTKAIHMLSQVRSLMQNWIQNVFSQSKAGQFIKLSASISGYSLHITKLSNDKTEKLKIKAHWT